MTEPYTILPWDSDFFGFRVVRITSARLTEGKLKEVLRRMGQERIRLAYWSCDPRDSESHLAATICGGFLVDRKTTFVVNLDGALPEQPGADGAVITRYTEAAPTPALIRLALESGGFSRFRTDARFPEALFRRLYEHWISASVEKKIADDVFVSRGASDVVGMITVRKDAGCGWIGLMAVDAALQGRGVGSSLITAAHRWFRQRDLKLGRVVTQGANVAACRLYVSCGYRLERVEHVYHFWM